MPSWTQVVRNVVLLGGNLFSNKRKPHQGVYDYTIKLKFRESAGRLDWIFKMHSFCWWSMKSGRHVSIFEIQNQVLSFPLTIAIYHKMHFVSPLKLYFRTKQKLSEKHFWICDDYLDGRIFWIFLNNPLNGTNVPIKLI